MRVHPACSTVTHWGNYAEFILGPSFQCRFSSGSGSIHKPSNTLCLGCGSNLQAYDPDVKGYIPPSVEYGFSGGWKKRWVGVQGRVVTNVPGGVDSAPMSSVRIKTTRIYCQRCYRLQQYGRIEHPVGFDFGRRIPSSRVLLDEIISSIPSRSVVLHIIDVLNLESSSLPEIYEKLSRKGVSVISVVNKMDCLPTCEGATADSISKWTRGLVKVLRRNVGPDGKPNLVALSSASGEGFANLETILSKFISIKNPKDIVVVGSVNSGKSMFCNRFLAHIGFKHLGHIHFQRGVGGVTRSSVPGTTQGRVVFPLHDGISLVDTPGISVNGSMLSYMVSSDDFKSLSSGRKLQPPVFTVKEGKTLFIGAMASVSLQAGLSAQIAPFVSPQVTLHICKRSNADDVLRRKAGTFLYPPFTDPRTGIVTTGQQEWTKHRVRVFCAPSRSYDDIVIEGLGWISVYGHGHKLLDICVPRGVNVFRRPSMLPKFIRLHGSSVAGFRSRGRSLRMTKLKRKLTRIAKENGSRETWRDGTHTAEMKQKYMGNEPPDPDLVSEETQNSYVVVQ